MAHGVDPAHGLPVRTAVAPPTGSVERVQQ
jgi:hypothetical protein